MTEEKRTQFAMAAVDFASLFNNTFADLQASGYRLQLTAPEGQSTGGGVQARQHITLQDGAGDSIVAGACNTVEKTAELKSYAYVSSQYRRYEDKPFPIDKVQYDDIAKQLDRFFTSQLFQLKNVEGADKGHQAERARAKSSVGLIVAIIVLLLALAGGLVWYFVFYQQG
ncbi:MAG: hypothetical protein JXR96_28120 [Deltaproteobacteria bacterium]|nr:hypothetical protein [Deltaproteobacteria bacterium]